MQDTGGYVALVWKKDEYHERAKVAYRKLLDQNYTFVTTNYILAETYTAIQTRIKPLQLGHQTAVVFGERIRKAANGGLVRVVRISEDQEKAAWELFKRYDDKEFSLLIVQYLW